jgi:hypothetical protein
VLELKPETRAARCRAEAQLARSEAKLLEDQMARNLLLEIARLYEALADRLCFPQVPETSGKLLKKPTAPRRPSCRPSAERSSTVA